MRWMMLVITDECPTYSAIYAAMAPFGRIDYPDGEADPSLWDYWGENDGTAFGEWVSGPRAVSVPRWRCGASEAAPVFFGYIKGGLWVDNSAHSPTWDADFRAMIAALPNDAWLTVVHCHG